MGRRASGLGLAALAAALSAAVPASAGRYNDWERWLASGTDVQPARPSAWQVSIGAGAGLAPEYLGSDDFELKPLPLVDIEYRGRLFASTQRGLGYNLIRTTNARIGPRLTFDFGRDSGDSESLNGLPDISPGLELGAFMEFKTGPYRFRLNGRKEIAGGHDGALLTADAAYGGRWSRNASLIVGAEVTLMDSIYAENVFGVDTQFATKERPSYSPSGGLRDVGIYIHVIYDISREVFLSGDFRLNALLGDAVDSPLTESQEQLFGGFLLGYRF